MTEQRHLIWSNYDLDYEDWRDDLEEDHPELTEDERMALTVSYTHLDVYKRQILECSASKSPDWLLFQTRPAYLATEAWESKRWLSLIHI